MYVYSSSNAKDNVKYVVCEVMCSVGTGNCPYYNNAEEIVLYDGLDRMELIYDIHKNQIHVIICAQWCKTMMDQL